MDCVKRRPFISWLAPPLTRIERPQGVFVGAAEASNGILMVLFVLVHRLHAVIIFCGNTQYTVALNSSAGQ